MVILFDIQLGIIVAFLLSTSLIAFYAIRKFTTFRVYAVGNRKFSTASLVSTTLACYCGGGILTTHMTQFYHGLYWVGWRWFGSVAAFCMLSWLGARMSQYMYHVSMPETMGRMYGKYPRVITALLSVGFSTALLAMQIYIMSRVIGICIASISPLFITILATIMLVGYATFGGIRAVVFTDIWQSITFSLLICSLAWFMFKQTDRSVLETIASVTAQKKFHLSSLLDHDGKLVATLRYLATVVGCVEPAFMQSVYMSSSPFQAKKVFLYAALFSFIIMVCCTLVGLFTFSWIPPGLSEPDTWNYIMAHISPFWKGMLSTCLLALAMSTADSRLHICAVMISYDILPVIWPKYFKKHPSCISYYRIAHIAILFVAMLSIGTALMSSDLWLIGSVINGYIRWYVPIIVAPFILAVLGFRTSTTAALIGMATGGIAVCTWRTWIYPLVGTDNSSFVCMLINGLAMLAAHYILPRSKKHIVNLDEGFEKIKQCYNRKVTNRISS